VCIIDIFCCTTQWDEFCAATARQNPACDKICPDPPCGDPDAGNCCFPHDNASCNDAECCETVCDIDPACCETVWDSICASIATTEIYTHVDEDRLAATFDRFHPRAQKGGSPR
jgi:hypothetical protein